jgi:hypothetical protein
MKKGPMPGLLVLGLVSAWLAPAGYLLVRFVSAPPASNLKRDLAFSDETEQVFLGWIILNILFCLSVVAVLLIRPQLGGKLLGFETSPSRASLLKAAAFFMIMLLSCIILKINI